jgi:hypothetical protein
MRSRLLWTAVATLLLLDAAGIAIGRVLRAQREDADRPLRS